MSDGIFVNKGTTFSIPSFSLTIDANGETSISPVEVHLAYDVCPVWVKLAHEHLDLAKQRKLETVAAWKGTDEDRKTVALEAEFEASMQALSSAVFAIDAMYAWLKPHAGLDQATLDAWRDNGTSRYKQIGEVFRRCFSLNPPLSTGLIKYLGELYGLRDQVVHPPAKAQATLFRPDLNVGVEWRFAQYSADPIERNVVSATGIIYDFAHRSGAINQKLQDYLDRLRARLVPLFPTGHPNEAYSKKSPTA